MSKTLACAKCGAEFPFSGVGRPPKFCAIHRPSRNRKRDAKNAAKIVERVVENRDAAVERLAEFTSAEAVGLPPPGPEWNGHLLAIGLGLADGDVKLAGRLVGLQLAEGDLLALAEDVKARHVDLVKRRPGAVGRLLTGVMIRASIALAAHGDKLPPGQLAQMSAALRNLAQTNELICGAAIPTVGAIEWKIQPPGPV